MSGCHPAIGFILVLTTLTLIVIVITHPRVKDGVSRSGHGNVRAVVYLSVSGSVLTRSITPSHLSGDGVLVRGLMSGFDGSGVKLVIFTNSTFIRLPVADSCMSTGVFLRGVAPKLVRARNAGVNSTVSLTAGDFARRSGINETVVIVASNRGRRSNTGRTTRVTRGGNVGIFVLNVNGAGNTPVPVNSNSCLGSRTNGAIVATLGRRVYHRLTRTNGNRCVRISGADSTRGTLGSSLAGLRGNSVADIVCDTCSRRFRTINVLVVLLLVVRIYVLRMGGPLLEGVGFFGESSLGLPGWDLVHGTP